jgi:uncharacterized protein (DUF58 family)
VGLAAALLRRVDLLVLAAPLALAGLPLARRRPGTPSVELELSEEYPGEGAALQARVAASGARGAESMTVGLATSDWVRTPSGRRIASVVGVDAEGSATVAADLTAQRWGRSAVGPALVTLSAAWGLLRFGPVSLRERRANVFPLSERYRGTALVPRARGNVGLHRSLRAGEGTELSGIRPFLPGDRLRRINWRVSLRSGELHVNATTTERDADVVILLDGRYDAGISGGIHGSASGIDIGVRATASFAAFYLSLGDRVGLIAYTAHPRQLPARAGRRQLHLLLQALLDVTPPRRGGAEPAMPAPVGIDARALVLVVSPLVGRQVFDRAAALARRGHSVVAVDTLPEDARDDDDVDVWTRPVLRMWRLERATRIAQLRGLGVPVVPWRGPGTLDGVLGELARAAAQAGRNR